MKNALDAAAPAAAAEGEGGATSGAVAKGEGAWSIGEKILYRVLTWFARFMGAVPPRLSDRLGARLGRCLWPLVPSRRKIARANLDRVYGERLSAAAKERIAFLSFVEIFRNAFVLLTAAQTPTRKADTLCAVRNEQVLKAAAGKGAILVSGHLSNFTVMVGLLGRLGYDIAVLVRPLAVRPAEQVITDLRAESGVRTFDQGRSAMALVRHLSHGGITWFSLDQNARTGVMVEALGHPATAFPGPVKLARRLQIPIIPVFVHRIGPAKYELDVGEPIRLPPAEPTDAEVAADLMRLMHLLDARIHAHPEEWLWCHRRWRTADKRMAERAARGEA